MSIFVNENGTLVRKDAAEASQLAYDNTSSGLSANTVQGAIDEIDGSVDTLNSSLTDQQGEIEAILNVYGSKNICPAESKTIEAYGFTFTADNKGYMTCSTSNDTRTWNYNYANQFFRLKAGTYFIKAFEKTAYTTGYVGLQIINSNGNSIFTATWATLLSTGQTFTLAADTDIGVEYKLGDGAYAFMIMDNRIKDKTYVPYAPTNRDCMSYAVNSKLGAHNLAQCTDTANSTSKGVTFAVNSEKIVTATWSSTPTGSGIRCYSLQDTFTGNLEVGKTYRLTGCPNGGSWSAGAYKWHLYVYDSVTSSNICADYGNGATFTVESGKKYALWMAVGPNAGSSGSLTFKPLVTLIEDTDTTYTPYAMTNRELTEVKTLTPTITSSAYTVTSQTVKRCGNVVQVWIRLKLSNAVSAGGNADGTVSGIPVPIADIMNLGYNGATIIGILFQATGNLRIRAFTSLAANTDIDATFTYIAKQ